LRPIQRLAVVLASASALIFAALPASASAPGNPASGEAPPPAVDVRTDASAARAAVGQTTTYVDDAGRTVFRVDDGFDLDQYRYRGALTFSFDIDKDYGPVDALGHPAPGNKLYGKSMLLTLRAWDVDEVQGEVDDVRFNGNLLVPGQLSGADNQWATDTLDVWASWLHLPTPDNPRGTNTIQVDVDRNNGGWAVEIDWAELRPLVTHDAVRPVVLAHGITDNGQGSARSGMWQFDDFLQDAVPDLQGRTSSPPMTLNGAIKANAAILGDAIDDVVVGEPSDQVDIVAHSMGGLDARLYAFDNPGRVRNLVMVGTPNGGSELAVALCSLRLQKKLPTGLVPWLLRDIEPSFGECDGPQNGLYQLLPSYVRDVFNRQVPDRPTVDYVTIAGRKGGAGSIITDGFGPGILGEDDGTVSTASVRWLSFTNADHPGLHSSTYPTVDRDHMGLVREVDDENPLSFAMAACDVAYFAADFCPLPFDLDGTESAEDVVSARASEPVATAQVGVGPAAVIAPGQSIELPVDVAPGERAGLIVFADEGLAVQLDVAGLTATDVFGSAALGASFTGPATLSVQNPTAEPLQVASLLTLASTRALQLSVPTLVGAGQTFTVDATMTGALPGETVQYVVSDSAGAAVAQGELADAGESTWTAEVTPPGPGSYSVAVSTLGARVRMAVAGVIVSEGGGFVGGFDESTGDLDGDSLIDTLVLEVPVDVARAGDYRVAARLVDASGQLVTTAGAGATLDEGRGTVVLELDGRQIHDRAGDGPWTLVDATLSDSEMNLVDIADLGPVRNDDAAEYEHDAVQVTDLGEQAVDHDGDGLTDVLALHASARVDVDDWYALNGKLVSSDGTEVGRVSSTVWLARGSTAISLDFDGAGIGATGKDGPFTLRDLTLYPTSSAGGGLALVDSYRTQAYRSAQFPGGTSADQLPVASVRVAAVDGTWVDLDATASTDDHGIVDVSWDLGDGTTASGPTVRHEYPAAGTYEVTVTVTDTGGQTSVAVITVVATTPTCDGLVATIVGDGRATLRGTAGDDVIVGTAADERIDGGQGNDVICGRGGDDTLLGANGADRLVGGDGDDRLEGGDGNDVLDGSGGDDTLVGANGTDRLVGGAGDDRLDGGDGHDELDGGDGRDSLVGANGDDTLVGGAGNDTLSGGDGNDVIDAGAGNDVINAANGNDVVTAGDGDDTVTTGEGADTVDAGAGNDRVLAGGGNDTVRAGEGDDHVEGGEGDDLLLGEAGNDTLLGGGGNDTLDGGPGLDVLDGGNGRNILRDVP
jgi:Ca2+-binding RTX toxin-like protein